MSEHSTMPGIQAEELRKYIIYPVLQSLYLYSKSAESLLLGTAALESSLGSYLRQPWGNDPARGIYQMRMSTLNDLYDNYLRYHWQLFQSVEKWRIVGIDREIDIIGNLYYATALCRVQYYRYSDILPIPENDDLPGLANYCIKFWNGLDYLTPEQFIQSYEKFIEHSI